MNMDSLNYYFGVSYEYPRRFNSQGSVALAGGIESINQSIRSRLTVKRGSRFLNRSYGSDLHRLVFESNDSVFKSLARYFIQEALVPEKRIFLTSVEFEQVDSSQVNISINYVLRSTNEPGTLIYPFNTLR